MLAHRNPDAQLRDGFIELLQWANEQPWGADVVWDPLLQWFAILHTAPEHALPALQQIVHILKDCPRPEWIADAAYTPFSENIKHARKNQKPAYYAAMGHLDAFSSLGSH